MSVQLIKPLERAGDFLSTVSQFIISVADTARPLETATQRHAQAEEIYTSLRPSVRQNTGANLWTFQQSSRQLIPNAPLLLPSVSCWSKSCVAEETLMTAKMKSESSLEAHEDSELRLVSARVCLMIWLCDRCHLWLVIGQADHNPGLWLAVTDQA